TGPASGGTSGLVRKPQRHHGPGDLRPGPGGAAGEGRGPSGGRGPGPRRRRGRRPEEGPGITARPVDPGPFGAGAGTMDDMSLAADRLVDWKTAATVGR